MILAWGDPRTGVRGYDMKKLIVVFCVVVFACNALAQSNAPEQCVVVDLHRPWLDGANWDNNTPPVIYGVDATRRQPRFMIADSNAQSLWVYRFAIPIDLAKYPILLMKYRCSGTSGDAGYVLRLVTNKNDQRNRIDVWKGSDLVADARGHELRQDLRELNADGSLGTIGIGFKTDNGPGHLELLELMFSSDANTSEKIERRPRDDRSRHGYVESAAGRGEGNRRC